MTLPLNTEEIERTIARGKAAVLDIGDYTITILPKLRGAQRKSRRTEQTDEAIWRKVEKSYRRTRAALTKERYSYLYG